MVDGIAEFRQAESETFDEETTDTTSDTTDSDDSGGGGGGDAFTGADRDLQEAEESLADDTGGGGGGSDSGDDALTPADRDLQEAEESLADEETDALTPADRDLQQAEQRERESGGVSDAPTPTDTADEMPMDEPVSDAPADQQPEQTQQQTRDRRALTPADRELAAGELAARPFTTADRELVEAARREQAVTRSDRELIAAERRARRQQAREEFVEGLVDADRELAQGEARARQRQAQQALTQADTELLRGERRARISQRRAPTTATTREQLSPETVAAVEAAGGVVPEQGVQRPTLQVAAGGFRERVAQPAGEIAGDIAAPASQLLEPTGLAQGAPEIDIDFAEDADEGPIETGTEKFIGGGAGQLGTAAITAPAIPARAAQVSQQAGVFTAEAIEEEGVGGGLATSGQAAVGATADVVSQSVEQALENPIETTGALTLSAGALSAGGAPARFAIQPGEEIATGVATRAAPSIAARFPNNRIDNEEIVLREAARVERRISGGAARLGERVADVDAATVRQTLVDRTPTVEPPVRVQRTLSPGGVGTAIDLQPGPVTPGRIAAGARAVRQRARQVRETLADRTPNAPVEVQRTLTPEGVEREFTTTIDTPSVPDRIRELGQRVRREARRRRFERPPQREGEVIDPTDRAGPMVLDVGPEGQPRALVQDFRGLETESEPDAEATDPVGGATTEVDQETGEGAVEVMQQDVRQLEGPEAETETERTGVGREFDRRFGRVEAPGEAPPEPTAADVGPLLDTDPGTMLGRTPDTGIAGAVGQTPELDIGDELGIDTETDIETGIDLEGELEQEREGETGTETETEFDDELLLEQEVEQEQEQELELELETESESETEVDFLRQSPEELLFPGEVGAFEKRFADDVATPEEVLDSDL